jgi:hypothetical protein
LLAAAQLTQAAEPIGRIFYTPEQRAQLDALRSQKAVALQVRDEPVPEIVTYKGIVRRSDGKATVWVNNEALSEAELRDKQSIVGRVDRNGQILLQTPQAASRQLQLKVGQSAELLSGRIDEPYAVQRTAPVVEPKPESSKPKTNDASGSPESSPARRPPNSAEGGNAPSALSDKPADQR